MPDEYLTCWAVAGVALAPKMPAPASAESPHNTPRRSQPIRWIVSSRLLVVHISRFGWGLRPRWRSWAFLATRNRRGRGNAIDGRGPPEDRLGADRRTAYMFGHAGGWANPRKAATTARSRQGSPERARHSYTSLPRLTDAQLEASGTGMSALYCQRRIGHQRLSKRAKRGFRGYPIATVALYGPDDRAATKLTGGIVSGGTCRGHRP